LTHSTNLEDPGNLVKRTSEPAALSSSNPLYDTVNGRLSFPIAGPSSLVQSSNTGRLSFPSATSESLGDARDPIHDDPLTLQPIITPITTTDEILGPDKRKVQFTVGPKNTSAACLKNGKALSKFWADEDTDATDSTFDPESDSEGHKINSSAAKEGSLFTPFMSRRQKKSNKKKHANKLNDTMVQSTSSEHIQTRSKKGVI